MNRPIKRWHLLAILFGVPFGLMVSKQFVPKPPNLAGQGISSIHVKIRAHGDDRPDIDSTSTESEMIERLAGLVSSGKSIAVCRCGSFGKIEFLREDGTSETIHLVPAHSDDMIEFSANGGRFQIDRSRFLEIVRRLRVPEERWSSPVSE